MGRGGAVEQYVRLIPDERARVGVAQRREHPAIERGQLGVERRAADRQGAGLPHRSRPRLVEQFVAEQRRRSLEASGDVGPCAREPVLKPDPAGPGRVAPELIEGMLDREVGQVVAGESERRIRQAAVLNSPVGRALTLETLVEQVLVKVEQRQHAVARERSHRVRDVGEVGIVVDTRRGLERLPDHPDPDRVEPNLRQERRVVIAEPGGVRVVRRELVDHVDPVHDHDPSARVGDPAAGMAERQRRRRVRCTGGRHREQHARDPE